jgi:hypothetical protein
MWTTGKTSNSKIPKVGKYFPLAFGKKKYSSGNCSFDYTKIFQCCLKKVGGPFELLFVDLLAVVMF